MRTLIVTTALGAVLLAAPIATPAAEPAISGTVSSRFTGSSTLHDFSGSAPPTSFSLEPAGDGTWAATVEVSVDALTTDNGVRDRKMREMFHATEHPTLRAEFAHVLPEEVRTSGRLPFRLTIAGVSRDVMSTVREWRQTETQVDFITALDLSLVEFGLDAPRAFVFVVADSVHVTTEVSLKRE